MTCAQILKRPAFENLGQAVDWEIRHDQVPYELPIALPAAAWRSLPDALSEALHAVRIAQAAFDHLQQAMSDSATSDPGIIGLIELSSRGLQHVSETEGALLDDVEMILRAAVSRMMENEVSGRGKERKS